MSIKDGLLWFSVVPHKNEAFFHYLEVGIFHSNFIFPYVLGPLFRSDEDLRLSMEVVDVLKFYLVYIAIVFFKF